MFFLLYFFSVVQFFTFFTEEWYADFTLCCL